MVMTNPEYDLNGRLLDYEGLWFEYVEWVTEMDEMCGRGWWTDTDFKDWMHSRYECGDLVDVHPDPEQIPIGSGMVAW